jgi:hypothetical protein
MPVKKISVFLIVSFFSVALNGCIFLIASGVGAVGGYAITRDTIQGEYDARYSDAWKSAIHICDMLGTVTSRDSNKGTLEAAVDQAKVKVEIMQLTPESVRIKVKARKGIFPRLGTAERVFVKIVQQLM